MLPHLLKYLNEQVTGCLQGTDSLGIPLQLYFMEGSLVAAHAGDDNHSILRTLKQRDWLSDAQECDLETRLSTTGESIYTAILGLQKEPQVRETFYERFRENICRLLASQAPVSPML